ncbi:MAG TPA: MBL fold metallo-hydrolase [Candidatus Dormibacteraeota bacterium]|nr:MBL fold metallo-hydrolase [Candidatus Dormibacteraeota bacterium]
MFSIAQRSLYVPDLDLWIDASAGRKRCYVSHGHSDHARRHDQILATPESAAICRSRLGEDLVIETHAYGEPFSIGEARLTLFSAGHVLGSSQLLIESERGRFVYTGDFKLGPSLTCAPAEVERCDVVLMECTFGKPKYVFPPREDVCDALVTWARTALEQGATPVVLAYSLGKAQEAMAILGSAGLPLMVHAAIDKIARIYGEHGVDLPPYVPYAADETAGRVVILPPGSANERTLAPMTAPRTAMLSGWAVDASARYRYGVDAAFALSDHADFPALLRYVELAQPSKVLLNHGFRSFLHDLRRRGVNAEFLEEHAQLSLF